MLFRKSKPPQRRTRARGSAHRVAARHNALAAESHRLQREHEGLEPEPLTAAGVLIQEGQATYLRRLIQPWQIRSFGYYDLLGEIKYASQFYARALAGLELYAAERKPDGSIERTEDPKVKDALDRIRDPGGGGRAGLLSTYGRLMFLVGEALLFVSQNKDGVEQWEMLSTDELRLLDGSYTRFMAPSLPAASFRPAPDGDYVTVATKDQIENREAVAYRLWKRHPRFSSLPDATMEGVLDLCVAEGTMVNTLRGPVPIESVTTEDQVFTWAAVGLETRPVTRHLERGEQPVVKVTAGRRTLRATAEHPVLVLRKDRPGRGHRARYECEWAEAGSLVPGDNLVALDHVPEYGTFQEMPDGTPIFEDVAWLLGQIVGDGHVHAEGVNIAVYNEERRERIRLIVSENWGLVDHPQGGDSRFYSRALRRSCDRMGLRVKSHRKRIPSEILASPPAVKRAFLAGYEEADGHLTKQGWQSLALTSGRLARELRGLYIELGENVSNLSVEARAAVMTMPGGRTTKNAKPLHRFQVYYGSRRRGAARILQSKDAREQIGGEHFTLATVKRVEFDGVARTYDLEVEGEHNYIADGVVSHNCEELVLLTAAVRARARSRIANSGILFLDQRITTSPLEAVPDEDPLEDPFLEDLTESMTMPIVDEGSASAVVPLIARVKIPTGAKLADLVYHLQIIDPMQVYPETGLREECIRRIAIGLDMPPEVLLGLADVNHWTAWILDESIWKAHIQPVADGLVEDLTSAYLIPYLTKEGVEGADRFVIQYDASSVINHPDRGKDADELYDRRAIGKKALREAKGFDDADAPEDDELAEMIGVAIRDGSLAVYGIPSIKAGGIEPSAGVIEQPSPGVETGTPAAAKGAEAEKGPPPGGAPSANEAVVGALTVKVLGASQIGLLRAREAAGARIRSAAQRDRTASSDISGVAVREIASTLGSERVRTLVGGSKEAELVAGARPLVIDALRCFGITDRDVAATIADTIERHAARTLYQPDAVQLPGTFPAWLEGVLSMNGTNGSGSRR